MKILGILAGAAMLLGAQSAYAVSITNGSFESPIVSGSFDTYGNGSGSLTGWTIGGDSIDHIGSLWQASNGNQSLDMSGNDAGSISQTIGGLKVGQQYTVTFDLSGNPGGGVGLKSLDLTVDGITANYSYVVTPANSFSTMNWAAQVFVFYATATSTTLTFTSLTAGGYGPALDNVAIAATPIPGAILLFGSALGGLGFLGFRRKKKQAAA